MAKKPKRGAPTIDMTAMVDVAFLLLTFFILTTTRFREEEKVEAWQVLSEHTARNLPIIGLMDPPPQLVYVRNDFKNVPQVALSGWIAHSPGNTCPEVYFIEGGEPPVRSEPVSSED